LVSRSEGKEKEEGQMRTEKKSKAKMRKEKKRK